MYMYTGDTGTPILHLPVTMATQNQMKTSTSYHAYDFYWL